MPKNKNETLCVEDLRHAEYYEMQNTFDDLYAKSKNGDIFTHLMDIILSRENILLAYRNIKANAGSKTAGTDGTIIKDIGKLPAETVVKKVRYIVAGSPHGYRPKPVRRKEIPKPNGKTRPLGIPCMWDRLIQQCIKQVLEPICEAKFSENSYGFRPNRSVENAIKATYNRLQISQLHYVIEFDIKGFFDNVNHSKLIKQIWAMGIRDKHLIFILKRILKAPIKMTNGTITYPEKGTPQGGIISPLLANIVLNELDHWVESQWQENPVTKNYVVHINKSGSPCKSNAYKEMKKTKLKEMYMVRYADDFRVFCRYKESAEKAKIAITQWIEQRLKLEVSQEKTRIVNVRKRYSDFLGFKIKMIPRRKKLVVKSHISDKQFKNQKDKLVSQAKKIASPSKGKTELEETRLYNSMVLGMQNYYQIATNVNLDCMKLNRAVMAIFTNRLGTNKRGRLRKTGRQLTTKEATRYGKQIDYNIDIPEQPFHVKLDMDGYMRILNNLIQNVISHSHADKIEIILLKQEKNMQIRLSDNGIGIEKEDLKHIFERLYKCDKGRSEKGSGLGLSITHQLVEKMNGTITAKSVHGKGTEFILLFPLVD